MQLGISTLGHISEMGLNGKYKNLFDLHLKASEECLNFVEKSGINVIELIIESPVIANRENKQKFIDLVNSYSLEKQVHGPFIDMNLCSLNKYISKASIESYLEAIKLCDDIDSKMITIHPGSADFVVPSIREFNKTKLKSAIHQLFGTKTNENLMICLENMPQNYHIMTDNKNIEEVLNIIDHKNLFLTYDTSHFYTCDGDVQQLWMIFQKIIKNIHIVDNNSKLIDTHPPLGTGKVDFKKIFDIISEYNYNGSLILELSNAKSLNQSINFINKFL